MEICHFNGMRGHLAIEVSGGHREFFIAKGMKSFFDAICVVIIFQLLAMILLRMDRLQEQLVWVQKQRVAIHYCGRLAAFSENITMAKDYLQSQDSFSDSTLIEVEEFYDVWQQSWVEASPQPCDKLNHKIRLYQEGNEDLDDRYPNQRFTIQK